MANPLDSEAAQNRLNKLQAWWTMAKDYWRDSRLARIKDHDFNDGDQWSPEDLREFTSRGQKPCVYNLISPITAWVTGTFDKTRYDAAVQPRTEDDVRIASVKTKLVKYVADVNDAHTARQMAFLDAVISGLGWVEVGIRGDTEDEPVFIRYADWREIWHDPYSTDPDLSDARFIFRSRWVDLDVAAAMFPRRKTQLELCAENSQPFYNVDDDDSVYSDTAFTDSSGRKRVRLIECWCPEPASVKIVRAPRNSGWNGKEFTSADELQELEGMYSTYDAVRMKMRVSVFCGKYMLYDDFSPYSHNKFPYIPYWGNRKKRDNMPYGIVRNLISAQEDLNKRYSKALWLLTAQRAVLDKGAVDDLDDLADEIARPDGIIEKNPGKNLEIIYNAELSAAHISLLKENAAYIQESSGITDENVGRSTNAVSGKAILARQEQGGVVSSHFFSNARLALALEGRIALSLMEQYYDYEKVVRIAGDEDREFIVVNKTSAEGGVLNDITATQADFIVSPQNSSSTVRQAMFESMMELASKLPAEISINLIDLIVGMTDLPNKSEIIKRINSMQSSMQAAADQGRNTADASALIELQAEKLKADIALIAQKAETERVNQAVAMAGVEFDRQNLQTRRVEVLSGMNKRETKGLYNEKGMKSNNKEGEHAGKRN